MRAATSMLLLATVAGVLLLDSGADARRKGKGLCGLKCFSWKKCMGQLGSGNNRPGELGNTGQIVLNECDSGGCDCAAEEKAKKAAAAASKAAAAAAAATTARPSATAFTRTRTSLTNFRRNPLRTRHRGLSTSQKKEQAAQKTQNRISKPRVVSTSQSATYSVSSSTSSSRGGGGGASDRRIVTSANKRDFIKDQIGGGSKSKTKKIRFPNFGYNASNGDSRKSDSATESLLERRRRLFKRLRRY